MQKEKERSSIQNNRGLLDLSEVNGNVVGGINLAYVVTSTLLTHSFST